MEFLSKEGLTYFWSKLKTRFDNLTEVTNTNTTNLANEISTRTSQDSVLQAEINQLVAPTGTAPSAAEIENARVGADGVTYSTLGDAIRTQFSDLKSGFYNWSGSAVGNQFITLTKGAYIDVRNSTVDITDIRAASGWQYAVVPCVPDDVFTLNGESGSAGRLWGFCDSSGNNLGYANESITGNNLVVTAPANASYLVINSRTTSANSVCFKNKPITETIADNEMSTSSFRETADYNSEYQIITLQSGYIKCDSGTVDPKAIKPDSTWLHGVKTCSQNDILVVSGRGSTGHARLYAFCGSDGTILSNASSASETDNAMAIAPEGAAYVVVNTKIDAAKKSFYIKNSSKDIKEEVFDYGIEQGGIDQYGYDRTLSYGIRSGFVPVKIGDAIKWYEGTSGYVEVFKYSSDKILISSTGWVYHSDYIADHNGYIRIVYMVNYSTPLDETAITKYGHYLYVARDYTFPEDYRRVKESIAELYHPPFPGQEKAFVSKVMSDRDKNTICFAIIADTHNKKGAGPTRDTIHHATVFNRIAEQCGAQFSAHIGDVIHGSQTTLEANMNDLVSYWKEQNKTFLPMLYSIAYHDLSGDGGRTRAEGEASAISVSEALGVCQFNTKYLNVEYSSDYTSLCFDLQNRIRFFVLNGDAFTWSTVSFVQSKLANTTLPVVVISHLPLSKYANFGGFVPANGNEIQTLLNNYAGDVLVHIHGHVHWDNIVVLPNDSFPHYSVLNACPLQDDVEANKGDCLGDPITYPRTVGDYSEYAFDVFNIHLDTGVVKSFRFGAGLDREYNPN